MQKLFALGFALSALFVPCRLHSQEQNPRELFSEAYALFSQGDSRQAEETFLKTLDRAYLLEDYSLYYLGQIAVNGGNLPAARQYFSQLQQKFPNSVWAPQAGLQLAKLSLTEKNYLRAMEQLRALRSQRARKEISDEAGYLLGQAQEALQDWKQSYSTYQELRRASALSPWAAAARKSVAALREKFPDLFALTTPEALLSEGELLTREQAYPEAEKLYRNLLEQTPQGNLRPRVLMALGSLYQAQRKRDEAAPILTEVVQGFRESPEAPTALHQLALNYWNRDDDLKALEYFRLLRERYPKSAFVDFAEFASARIYESLGRIDEALAAYQNILKKSLDKQLREEAAWRSAWIYYLRADDNRANAAFKRLAVSGEAARYGTAARYWQARTAHRMGQSEEAKQIFLAILSEPEESYYKGAAAGWLTRMGVAVEEKKAAEPSVSTATVPVLSSVQSFHLARAHELADLALNPMAVAELDEVKNLGDEELSLRFLLMREYARNSAYARSVALANQIPRSSEELARYRYPLAYWDTVQKLAQEKTLDPYFVVALIRQESLFDPKAISPASALGLMQLLPSTAAKVATQLGLPPPQRERLFEPALNLTLGMHHLRDLLQRYSKSLVKAIAAYNAGENAVSRWEAQIVTADEDEFIERIPYAETRLYVKLVLRNLRLYRKIYGEQK